jgi:pyruvate/2-oxoglutarate dehydrogenase complex dihydrolipoamide acyltransferase (E2) component
MPVAHSKKHELRLFSWLMIPVMTVLVVLFMRSQGEGSWFSIPGVSIFQSTDEFHVRNATVGRAVEKPAVYQGNICVRTMMTLSLTFDHRVTDGAPAMRFLRTVADYLEEPALILT